MTTYGPKNPQQIQGNGGWTNLDAAKVHDGTAASAVASPSVLPQITPTKFELGVHERPTSLTLKFWRKASVAGVKDDVVKLFKNGGIGQNIAGQAEWATDWEEVVYVFTADIPGPHDVNSDQFGVRMQAKGNGTVYIDGITLQAN